MVPPSHLPEPDAANLAQSEALRAKILADIALSGSIGFDRFMQHALYAPGLGYYSSAQRKFGAQGDFITAPMLGNTFAQALYAQSRQWQTHFGLPCRWLEFGAGNGQLAADILRQAFNESLSQDGMQYWILELSADLAAQQKATIERVAPEALPYVSWLSTLPENFEGVMLANEVLDAMPVQVFEMSHEGEVLEIAVGQVRGLLVEERRVADAALISAVRALERARGEAFSPGYRSEICPQGQAWVASLAKTSARAAMLFVDYGFDQGQYYASARRGGTLMAHYKHRAHTEILRWPGLQDITAHVDFSAIWQSANAAGLELLGYVNQANFLMNCDALKASDAHDEITRARHHQAIQKLTAESEMGELFKVIAFAKLSAEDLSNPKLWQAPSLGFRRGERSGWL